MEVTIAKHCVGQDPQTGLSPMQTQLLTSPKPVRIASAPTGAGKSYAFKQAMLKNERVLFIVPTKRLAQNLAVSLIEDLIEQDGWSEAKAVSKVEIWSGDRSKELKEDGETHIIARRCREIDNLDWTRQGGEMIVAILEVVVVLLLRKRLEAGLASKGIFDLAENFDHVVFDEFHTISSRGFGLAGVCALLAAKWQGARMKVSFLSATPLDIAAVLEKLGIGADKIDHISEPLLDSGRVVHGDVRLGLHEFADMASLVAHHLDEISTQINGGQMVVLIFDELREHQKQLAQLSDLFAKAGIRPKEGLVISSLDDSRQGGDPDGFFHWGRHRDPRNYKVLVATSSVEMGVTFRTNLLFMEPGFESLNFLQRYGRAARGDIDGHVAVRIDKNSQKRAWLSKLRKFIVEHEDRKIEIEQLTKVLTKKIRKRFRSQAESCFGALSNRAIYTSGLFWNALIAHLSMKGYQAAHLRKLQPAPSKKIRALLAEVHKMERDSILGGPVKKWCHRFENEVYRLRDIGPKIRVIEEPNHHILEISEEWLQKNTDILKRYPVCEGKDGYPEVYVEKKYEAYLLDKKNYIKRQVETIFPHTEYTEWLDTGPELVIHWCQYLKNDRSALDAWEHFPESMQAALDLVRLTGLVVGNETVGMEAGAQIL
jgi:CRISPR-associated endonuclease/helicase Cas3